ncbi:LpxL/LpxP family acyltransferase [Henriciella litoralis]|uniref:LpxL/LpxP family acyltransferase n=1 Tax=Henriciella litoralis TaxID=568102 RepID=UPI001F3D95C3|nr:lipid A biosynthesis acyltransferase [Henriciella litoralis]
MASNWTNLSERGSFIWILTTAWIYRLVGRRVTLVIISPVILFYYLTGREARRASRAYLERIHAQGLLEKRPGFWSGFRHFMAFSGSLIDKLAGWTGDINADHVEGADGAEFSAAKASGKGAMVLTAHVGNPELIRAVASVGRRFAVTVLMHTKNAEHYNAVIRKFSPDSRVKIIEVSQIDVTTAMRLSSAIENGEWVVMAADRLPPKSKASATGAPASLLGGDMYYPVGPYVLASALKCPVYFLQCIRTKGAQPFRIVFHHFADRIQLPSKARKKALRGYMDQYSQLLTEVLKQAPYQWFNFYDYWEDFSSAETSCDASNAHPPLKKETTA